MVYNNTVCALFDVLLRPFLTHAADGTPAHPVPGRKTEAVMTVTLLTHTPEPERLVAAAAKLCYSQKSVGELMDGLTPEKTASFVEMLAEFGHESPIEHVTFTFGIEGVSRALLAQITRHRIASYSVQSQRYVRKGAFEYITPPAIAADPEAEALYRQAMADCQSVYDRLAERLTDLQAARLEKEGAAPDEARKRGAKLANEDARFVLPNACETRMVVTMNARSLMNFFAHRCCNRAQWEIRALAEEMLRLCRGAAPTLFRYAGPSCVRGACPEGNMSCGHAAEMREKYKFTPEETGATGAE